MLAGGGTGGHVYPLLAVWHALSALEPPLTARWVGSERIESRLVPAAGVDFHQIDIRFSYRRPTPDNWRYYRLHILPLLCGKPFRQALAAVDAFRPGLVLASGGYVAAPTLWAAARRRVPIALLEINSPPGLVNWHFAPGSWRVYAATARIAQRFTGRCGATKLRTLGFPVLPPRRNRAQVCRDYGLEPWRRVLLAVGGSLGAGAIHHAVREVLDAAARSGDPRWSQLAVLNTGGERQQLMQAELDVASLPAGPVQYRSTGYLEDSVGALAASDFYLGRSGAATVGELIACGLPALLIPDPQHADRQQYTNTGPLLASGQGTLLEQDQVTGEALLSWLDTVWEQPRLAPPKPPAADAIAADLLTLWEAR